MRKLSYSGRIQDTFNKKLKNKKEHQRVFLSSFMSSVRVFIAHRYFHPFYLRPPCPTQTAALVHKNLHDFLRSSPFFMKLLILEGPQWLFYFFKLHFSFATSWWQAISKGSTGYRFFMGFPENRFAILTWNGRTEHVRWHCIDEIWPQIFSLPFLSQLRQVCRWWFFSFKHRQMWKL